MNTAIAATFIFGVVFGIVGYLWLTAPERRRQRQRTVRAIDRADLWHWTATVAQQERNDARDLLDGERSKNRALTAANDRLYNCLRDRMDEDEYAALQKGLTVYDRTVADFERWESEL